MYAPPPPPPPPPPPLRGGRGATVAVAMTGCLKHERLCPAPRQRCADQRAVGAFGPCRRAVEAKPRQAFAIARVRDAHKSLPQQSRQALRHTLRVLQQLQRRYQPLLDICKIAAERKRRQQACCPR